jgi:hypothetical protein
VLLRTSCANSALDAVGLVRFKSSEDALGTTASRLSSGVRVALMLRCKPIESKCHAASQPHYFAQAYRNQSMAQDKLW